ncbi:MAG: riboflavin biosynthesis protein RibF [Parabacteroides sp.]|nr:riboflavin biosynthesis protein RibF [Parabacteroides sp.]MDY4758320.1 riboflavin biosynthesis protein RibF [Parabacteroides sp.]
MRVIHDTQAITEPGVMATIGFFDGVHVGHRFLIDEVKAAAAERGLPSAVITFPLHPRAVLQKDYQPRLLNSFEDKLRLLATTGVDYCIVLDFTVALSQLSAEAFLHILATEWRVKGLVIGYDHRFGHDRRDGFEQYVQYGQRWGIEVLKAAAFDEGHTAVSSSEIRRLVQEGQVERAAQLLTYAYPISGRIVSGYKVGRTLGFPTANIQPDDPMQLLPGIGVYAVWVEVAGQRYKGMLYIGSRPTLDNGTQLSIEVHILHFSGDIYDDPIRVTFVHFVRGDEKFDSLEALKAQLMRDRETVDQLLN